MEQRKIDRINELAKYAKERELTDAEIEERTLLREEYLASVRSNLRSTLENTYIERPDGSREKLKQGSN